MKQAVKAQSLMEYCLLIGILALALAGMQTYARRGVQAVIKTTADKVGRHGHLEAMEDTGEWLDEWNPQYSRLKAKSKNLKQQNVDHGKYMATEVTSQQADSQGVTISAIVTDKTNPE